MCGSATTKTRHVILDFDMVSEIITLEQKGRFGKEKQQNLETRMILVEEKWYNKILNLIKNLFKRF